MPTVIGERQTMAEVVGKGRSIARFGDGELKIMEGSSCKLQNHDPDLAKRLRRILQNGDERVLVGVPNIWNGGVPAAKVRFWNSMKARFEALMVEGQTYHSAFVTRPDSAPEHIDNDRYWELVQQAWACRPAVVVTGSGKGRRFLKMVGQRAHLVDLIETPRNSSWSDHTRIRAECLGWFRLHPDGVAILSTGPAATVLAFELGVRNCQALDLGHMACFWAKTTPKEDAE